MSKITKDMLSWCVSTDVIKWLSNQASKDGDYIAVEAVAMSEDDSVVLNVSDDEYTASVIYCAMMHLSALVSFIDTWDVVTWEDGILTFYASNKYTEQANCKYNPDVGNTGTTTWTREYLETIWKRMRHE